MDFLERRLRVLVMTLPRVRVKAGSRPGPSPLDRTKAPQGHPKRLLSGILLTAQRVPGAEAKGAGLAMTLPRVRVKAGSGPVPSPLIPSHPIRGAAAGASWGQPTRPSRDALQVARAAPTGSQGIAPR